MSDGNKQAYFRIKRILDFALALLSLILLSPIFLFAAVGIKMSSPGKIFYRAKRMGKGNQPFEMYKFRTMHENSDQFGSITAVNDNRIFSFGNILRKTKIDELPQLINIIKNQMSIVGPRPEDVEIVKKHYTERQMHTLDVKPGLASPGSIFNYTHGDSFLEGKDSEYLYLNRFMPLKLEMELIYIKNCSLQYDVKIILRTLYVVFSRVAGKKNYKLPLEYKMIQKEKRAKRRKL